jgi:hypothetical protein
VIYLIQVTNSQLIPAFLSVLRHSSRLINDNIKIIIVCPQNSRRYFTSHASLFAKKYSVNVTILPRLPYPFVRLFNLFVGCFSNIVSICQSPYGYIGFYSSNWRCMLFVGDGFGIKSSQPMKHGKIKGVTKKVQHIPRYIYYPIFYSHSLQESGVCADLTLYNFVSKKQLLDMFELGLPLLRQCNLKVNHSSGYRQILIIAPSNFYENGRTSLCSEIVLYVEDLIVLLKNCVASSTLLIIKPHPYASSQKSFKLSKSIQSRFPGLNVFIEPTRMPLEQYMYLFKKHLVSPGLNVDMILLTYQTSWPSLLSLGIEVDIKVGFSSNKYIDLFEHASAIQRQSYQEMIPSNLLVK